MMVIHYDKAYYVNGEYVSRTRQGVRRAFREVKDVIIINAMQRAKYGQVVTVYQLPCGTWWHDKMNDRTGKA